MKRKSLKVFALGISITLAMIFGFSNKAVNNTKIEKTTSNPEAAALVDNYKEWQAKNISNKVDQVLTLSVGWMKGLSAEHSYGVGAVSIDRTSGKISLKVKDIADGDWQLWLIENRDGENTSAMPDKADKIVEVAKFSSKDGIINFEENVDVQLFSDIRIDRVAITRAGKNPTEAFVLTGSPTLFEKMQQKRFIAQRFQKEPETSLISKFFSLFSTSSVSADDDKDDDDSDDDKDDESYLSFLISSGRDIFNNEKFNGNGRTCATCHPESNNFTIDPAFIAALPPNNPLFVAEFNPNLSQNFEKPQLMRQFGLILENVDGFDDLANKFTLRSVNHTLGLSQSLKAPDPNFLIDFTTNGRNPNPTQRTGWGGDGSPGSGSLREFAIGAVVQHFPKRLNRVSGVDFRLPNDFELDAMEAFQLSLGRQEEINIRTLTIKDSKAVAGKALFLDTGTIGEPGRKNCNACHFNAGANSAFAL
ncbi:MAG: hypothetical protein JNN15_04515, partial [Blastocatellia bacterium]|nr:hypothetical protein [Blastocatellia bacterium]